MLSSFAVPGGVVRGTVTYLSRRRHADGQQPSSPQGAEGHLGTVRALGQEEVLVEPHHHLEEDIQNAHTHNDTPRVYRSNLVTYREADRWYHGLRPYRGAGFDSSPGHLLRYFSPVFPGYLKVSLS